jgi:hypothetical protein
MSDPQVLLEGDGSGTDPDCRTLVKVVQAAILVSLLWKTFYFIRLSAAHLAFPLEDPFFPWPLQRLETVRAAWILASASAGFVLFAKTQKNILRLTALNFVALAILCVHQMSFNDVTFFCCAWSSVWCLWMATRLHEPFECLFERSAWLTHLILSLIFIGGAVGKLTAGYWDGTVLYEIYFRDRDFWTYNLVRGLCPEDSLPVIAMWHSRVVVCAEWFCGFLWLMPRKTASVAAIVMLCGIALTNNFYLFSVVTCLIGLALVGLHQKKKLPESGQDDIFKSETG